MQAEIIGEDDVDIGTEVVDNNGANHQIEMHKSDGSIYAHHCNAYADEPKDRTLEENQHNEQARRYAKFYVYYERGYETVPRSARPEHIDAVRRAITALSPAEFQEFFGGTYQQLKSHFDDGVNRPVDLPADVPDENAILYKQDVYLGIDIEHDAIVDEAQTIAAEYGFDLSNGPDTRVLTELSREEVQRWETFADELTDTTDETDADLEPDLQHGAVSGLHVAYPKHGDLLTDRAEDPFDRDPDATLELIPIDHDSIEAFRSFLEHHLRCQVRDRFVSMGVVPPEPYRVLGMGTFTAYRRYTTYDMYPELHSTDADIEQFRSW